MAYISEHRVFFLFLFVLRLERVSTLLYFHMLNIYKIRAVLVGKGYQSCHIWEGMVVDHGVAMRIVLVAGE